MRQLSTRQDKDSSLVISIDQSQAFMLHSGMTTPALRPLRSSLVTETVKIMRQAIETGLWQECLPGERILCHQWQISRPTLRAAMEVLRSEGLVDVAHGRRTRLLVKKTAQPPSTLTVGLLSPEPLNAMPPFVMLWVDELRSQLATAGHLLHVQVGSGSFGKRRPGHNLATVVRDMPAAVWVLYQTTDPIKRWFAEHGVPCVVVGSHVPGIDLPTVDRDYRAVCRHAVGLLAGRGHRRLALLILKPQFGGDAESEAGFLEGLAARHTREVTGEVGHHDGTSSSVCRVIDGMLRRSPSPDAMLIARSSFALTALTHLLKLGIRIPEDMALLCRDDDAFLDSTVPRMARYVVSPSTFARNVFKTVMSLVKGGQVRRGNVRVMPVFVARESL
ncbi:MAG: alanine racemase [Verrucomicrobiaceae bacterium]|nr:alanine racemase [Verrucomicrobiaceae bacterium]